MRNLAALAALLLVTGCGSESALDSGGVGSAPATPPTLVSLKTIPANVPLPQGYPLHINLVATYSDGSKVDVAAQAQWSSSNSTVTGATGGNLQAATPGNTTVIGTFQGQSASTNVTVTQATLVSLEVTPATASALVGQQSVFLAAARFSDSSVVNVTDSALWSSSNLTVATISNTGVASALSVGATTIGTALNGKSGTSNLTVLAPGTGGGGFNFNGNGGFNFGGNGSFQFGGGGFQFGGGSGGFQFGGAGFQSGGFNFNF